jgi:hypothetical protein
MKSWNRLAAAAVVAAGLPAAMWLAGVMACGPDFEPEVFVQQNHPDSPKLYAAGHLGMVQSGYFHAELVVAYRYLTGGKLSDAEQNAYVPAPEPAFNGRNWEEQLRATEAKMPANLWVIARAAVPVAAPGAGKELNQNRVTETQRQGYVERDEQLNCPDAAFTTATATLARRTKQWGAGSAELIEWAKGQDAVFANCEKPGPMPAPAQASWSMLLKQDRAYQIAAAKFYGGDFDGARDAFVGIGNDTASPWSRWGEYLAARAEVRKAAATINAADYGQLANYYKDGLQAAQTRLLKLEHETTDAEIRHAVAAELEFIEVRLDPAKRLDEASNALAGPQPDREFEQDLTDLDFLMVHGVTGTTDAAKWIETMQFKDDLSPAKEASQAPDPLAMWREKHTTPWLVAAMATVQKGDAAESELVAAAVATKPDEPAYATVNYHRARLLLDEKKNAEARSLLTTVIAGLGPMAMASTRNAFLAERVQTARSLEQFLVDAPRTVIDTESSNAGMARCIDTKGQNHCTGAAAPKQFDADAVATLNAKLPLAVWQQAAVSTALPQNLRDAVAWAAWMRAIGLGDQAAVKQLSALLPQPVRQTAGDSDGFPATLALLRNPGMKPFLEQGVQRSVTYGQMESFGDNWWCGHWTDGGGKGGLNPADSNGGQPPPVVNAEFLTPEQKQQAAAEAARLNKLPQGVVWLGQRTIAYVKAHPQDKDAAEALGLTVRATRYGCAGQSNLDGQKAVSKQAFTMLHQMYPKSAWALKTKYYY